MEITMNMLSQKLPLIIGVVITVGSTCSWTSTAGATHAVVIEKELFITDLNVVNHPAEALAPSGAFHIHTLLEAMAPPGGSAKDILLSLVRGLRNTAPDLPSRSIDEVVINGWKRWKPDGTQIPLGDPLPDDGAWVVNWQKAPFRLLAIVNRIDLRANPTIRQAGEGRFVFCITDPDNPEDGEPRRFTIILEYLQPAANQTQVREIADEWHKLGAIPSFDQAYIDQLKIVTARFAGKSAMPGRPNGSALGQLRTNDIALNPTGGPGWELREFVLDAASGVLRPDTVKVTPHHGLHGSATLDFLIEILGEDAVGSFPSSLIGFRGITGFDAGFQWKGVTTPMNDTVLRRVSVNSCSGCHGGDGRTSDVARFYHTAPREKSDAAQLSVFLKGLPPGATGGVINPATGLSDPAFSDLEARRRDLSNLVEPSAVPFASAADAAEFVTERLEFQRSRQVRVH
jgi:hypothetical protein